MAIKFLSANRWQEVSLFRNTNSEGEKLDRVYVNKKVARG